MRAFPARQNSSLPLPWRMFVIASLVVLLYQFVVMPPYFR